MFNPFTRIYRGILFTALVLTGFCGRALADETNTYMIVDLSEGLTTTNNYPIAYANGEPAGVWTNSSYKTDKLVLRRISRGTFQMGSPKSEIGRATNGVEDVKAVIISNDFYCWLFHHARIENINCL